MSNIITIKNVRAYMGENGMAQINLEDAARGLGFIDGNSVRWARVRSYLDDFGFFATSGDGTKLQPGPETFIPENIFYRLAMKAKNETAERFQSMVADEILPSIRKHGAYMTPETIDKMISSPEFGIKLLTALKDEKEKVKSLTAKVEADHPKVLFADSVAASQTNILIGELAKILKQNGHEIGQNRLFEWMRKNGYLISRMGTDYNMPTQKSMEMGLFKIKETVVNHSDGHVSVSKTPKVTGKGQLYFVNRLAQKNE